MNHDLPPWLLEKAAAQMMDERALRALCEQRGISREQLDAHIAALHEDSARLLREHPPSELVPRIFNASSPRADAARRAPPSVPRAPLLLGAGGLMAACAAALLMFDMPGLSQRSQELELVPQADGVEHTRLKGAESALQIWRKAEQAERLKPGDTVRAGDLLQLTYQPAGAAHGVILSVDGHNQVTLHYPAHAGESTRLARGVTPLEYGYELDDAPDFERFFFITSAQPLDVHALLDAAEAMPARADALTLPGALSQTVFLLHKAEEPSP